MTVTDPTAVAITDRAVLSTDQVASLSRDLLDALADDRALVVWAGPADLREVWLEELQLPLEAVVDLGPDRLALEPLEFLLAIMAGLRWPAGQINIGCVAEDGFKLSAENAEDGNILSLLRAVQGAVSASGSVRQGAPVVLQTLATVLLRVRSPPALEYNVRALCGYWRSICELAATSLGDGGFHDWVSSLNWSQSEVVGFRPSQQCIAAASQAQRTLVNSIQVDKKIRLGLCLPTLQALHSVFGMEGLLRDTASLEKRIESASALCFSRGDFLVAQGFPGIGFLSYWRSYDLYSYLIGLERGLIEPLSSGKWRMTGGHGSGPVSIAKLNQALANDGVNLIPSGARRGARTLMEDARATRNYHWLIHGSTHPSGKVAAELRQWVEESISSYDRGRQRRWGSLIASLDRLDTTETLLGFLISTVASNWQITGSRE